MHIESLSRHLFSNFFENVNLSFSYDGLSPHQIWFNLDQGKQSYGGGGGGGGGGIQVENVLNRPGEIGLITKSIVRNFHLASFYLVNSLFQAK